MSKYAKFKSEKEPSVEVINPSASPKEEHRLLQALIRLVKATSGLGMIVVGPDAGLAQLSRVLGETAEDSLQNKRRLL